MAWLWKAVDYIPIIGTVKNGVEAAVAVARGDFDDAKEKGACCGIGLLTDVATVFTLGMGTAPAVAARVSARTIATAGGRAALKHVVKEGGKIVAKGAPAIIRACGITEMNKEGDTTSRHVINIKVLGVFKNAIDKFLLKRGTVAEVILQEETRVYEAYNNPLPADVVKYIKETMVVKTKQNHYDKNATTEFKRNIKLLSKFVVKYMVALADKNKVIISDLQKSIKTLVTALNKYQLYVDKDAKEQWLKEGGSSEDVFQNCLKQVAAMFHKMSNGEEFSVWVRELCSRDSC